MTNPTTRVLALLELLQTHGLTSGPALAAKLGVEPRTLRNYIRVLESLGVPVLAKRGRDGGYCLMQGFKLPPMMFTNDEALALALGLVASRSLGLAAATPASASALSKLERVMPAQVRGAMRAVSSSITLGSPAANTAGNGDALATLSAAAQHQQRVRLGYRSPQQPPTEREVDPYGLVYLESKWYLVAYCHLRQDTRSFRLDRIDAVAALPSSFGKPAGFDALAYMTAAITTLPRAHTVRVLLHTDLQTARAAIFTTLGMLEVISGGVLLHSQVDDLDWMARELARLPFAFAIEEPAALREALARHLEMLLACRALA